MEKALKTGIFEMRRHYSNYFKGIPDFKEYRMRLVSLQTFEEIQEVLDEIQHNFAEEAIY